MLPYRSAIVRDYKDAGGSVMLGNNTKLKIYGIGGTRIQMLQDVLYVPGLTLGLISIAVLDKNGYIIDFSKGICTVYNQAKSILLRATLKERLYYLDKEYLDEIFCSSTHNALTTMNNNLYHTKQNKNKNKEENKNKEDKYNNYNASITNNLAHYICNNVISDYNPLQELHRAWGHVSENYIKRALKEKMIDGCKYSYNDVKDYKLGVCISCMKGRMKAEPAGDLSNSKWNTLEKVGVDYKGPFRINSVHGYNGYIIFSDNDSNLVYVVLVKDKKEVCQVLEQFNNNIIVKYNKTWKVLQCDYDTIFNSDKVRRWLQHKSIILNRRYIL
jgi:hypothetical protein